jgi:NADPH:quinone reductase-like Zn-dependent oxidoreductase
MAVETACRGVDILGVSAGHKFMVHGAGTTVGFAAVQMALMRGARVIATAGDTFADRLRALGATVTPYGEGMVERVRAIAGGAPDLILDAAPISGALLDLVTIAGGDPRRVLTMSDFAGAAELGVRVSFRDDPATYRYDVLGQFAQLAASGRFSVPIARTFALEEWREALEPTRAGQAHHPAGRLDADRRIVTIAFPPQAQSRGSESVDAVLDSRYKACVFYTNRKGATGPVVDQATLHPAIGDVTLQDNAARPLSSPS